MKCPKCNGKPIKNLRAFNCTFCFGKRSLDWIDIIIGVKDNGTRYGGCWSSKKPIDPKEGDVYFNQVLNTSLVYQSGSWHRILDEV